MSNASPELTFIGDDETDPRKVLLKKDGTYLRTSRSVWVAAQAIRANDAARTKSIPVAILDAAAALLEPGRHWRPQRDQPRARIEIDLKGPITALAARLPSTMVLITIACISAAVNAAYLATHFQNSHEAITVISTVKIVVAMFAIVAIHEFAHASVATRYGCATYRLGIGIFFVLPVFYADVSEIWRLTRRRRLAVNAAGIAAQFVVGAGLVAAAIAYPVSFTLKALIWTNFASIILNVIPFAKLDGYWLLADALGIPDLQAKAFAKLRNPFDCRQDWQNSHEPFIAYYAVTGALFYSAIAAAALATVAGIGSAIFHAHSLSELSAAAASRPLAWLFALYIFLWLTRFAVKLTKGTKR